MVKKFRFDDVPRYRKWVKARDRALEELHTRAQLESTDVMKNSLTHVLQAARGYYQPAAHGIDAIEHFDHHIRSIFAEAGVQLSMILSKLKKRSYTLAKASESEILAQLIKRQVRASVTRMDMEKLAKKPTLAKGHPDHRIKLYLDRLRRKIVNQAQTSVLNAKDVNAFLIDVLYAFPRKRSIIRPKRILKPALMEAGDTPKVDAAIDLIDQEEWDDMLKAYKDEYVPKYRGPEYVVDMGTGDETDEWYAWEFERDLTNEFVSAVRDGQIDAARENGITDFVWIAVVDDVTDACCLWRDGLLTSEIEAQMPDHEGDDEGCDVEPDAGMTPPIHFNCRCTLAPASETMPEQPDDGSKDFGDWLDT